MIFLAETIKADPDLISYEKIGFMSPKAFLLVIILLVLIFIVMMKAAMT